MTGVSYESFYGLVERPFSLTPDPKYFFKSRSHGRAIESITFGLRKRESYLLISGDLGVGKTTVCRTIAEQLRRRIPVAYVGNPLMSPADLLRLLLQDFGAVSSQDSRAAGADATLQELYDAFVAFVASVKSVREGAVLVVDEAHHTPATLADHLTRLASMAVDGQRVMQIVFAAQPAGDDPGSLGIGSLDEEIATRARLLPLGREDCAAYVAHRLTIAGGTGVTFTPRALDVLFGLSGGVPRLVNLLCERALQEGAAAESRKIEPAFVEAAASALELLHARPKRFRWFQKRVS